MKETGHLTLPIFRALVSEIALVEEHDLEEAVLLLLEVEKTVVEGAGAAGLAETLTSWYYPPSSSEVWCDPPGW